MAHIPQAAATMIRILGHRATIHIHPITIVIIAQPRMWMRKASTTIIRSANLNIQAHLTTAIRI